jgi:glycerol-3-phosphate dehydrogenase (NAD(P)+)
VLLADLCLGSSYTMGSQNNREKQMKEKLVVLGGGSFGTVLANMIACNNFSVTLWMRDSKNARLCETTGSNERYLPGYELSEDLTISDNLSDCIRDAGVIIFAVPSGSLSELVGQVIGLIDMNVVVISTSKGIYGDNFSLPSQILEQSIPSARIGVLSGPNLAKEIACREITATVVASDDHAVCEILQKVLASNYFRVYANYDRFGVELAGALKNIYAIVSGIAEALGAGQNTKSVVLTRGLAEMSRFGQQLGADPMTFLGLSGVGDLFVTCSSPLSRNFQVGLGLGRGKTLAQSMNDVGQVAEGVNTTRLVKDKADKMGIYMPIVSALYETLFNDQSIERSLQIMMSAEQNTDVDFMVRQNE